MVQRSSLPIAWLKAHEDDPWVKNAILRVETLYNAAGPHVEAFRLRGLSAEERARAAWARLRKGKVDPRRVVEASLTVALTVQADLQPDSKSEYRRVQVAYRASCVPAIKRTGPSPPRQGC